MKRNAFIVLVLVVAAVAVLSGCDEVGEPNRSNSEFSEPVNACRTVYDAAHSSCMDQLGSTCAGFGCLFVGGQCNLEGCWSASSCCDTQDDQNACLEALPC